MYETIILAIACLSAPLFAKYAGYEIRKKPYDMVGVAGLFFLLAAAFSLGPSRVESLSNIGATGSIVCHVLGWLFLIVGAFRSMIDVLLEKEEEEPTGDSSSIPVRFLNGGASRPAHSKGWPPPARRGIRPGHKD